MTSYSYRIIDKYGKVIRGSMEAANEETVTSSLRAQGYIPISVTPQNIFTKDLDIQIGNPVKPRELSIFCRKFVSILAAGVPIINALVMIHEQTENKVLSKAIQSVLTNVEKGETLADAMRGQERIFTKLLIQMVEAGEASGNLEIAFERMAVQFEKDAKIKAQVKKAMIYPSIIGIVSVFVIIVMMIVVIPNFMTMFNGMDIELPAFTRSVINTSNFIKKWWYLIIGALVGIAAGIMIFNRTDTGKHFTGRIRLRMPIFGKLTVKAVSSSFTRTLSTLLAAGIPMIDAIDITARTFDNVIVKNALMEAKGEVAKGVSLSLPLKKAGFFPPMVHHMAKIGEETGNIEEILEKVADYYDEEVEIASQAFMAVIEPLIIIILALIVGGLVIAIMQPMMSMYNGIGIN